MAGRASSKTRMLKIGGLAVVVLVFALLLAVAGCAQNLPVPPGSSSHPAITSDQPCDSCKVTGHDYVHEAPYQGECARCHGLDSWTRVEYAHAVEDMNLGFHAIVGCGFCHTKQTPEPQAACVTCHEPVVHPLIPSCEKCHTPLAWRTPRPLPRKHVSLVNGHAKLMCFDCHRGSKAFTAPRSCASCHGKKHGGLRNCASCHDPKYRWKAKPGFNHNRYFRLTGRHRKIKCTKCHPRLNFVATRPRCSSCHGSKHGGFTDCARCHTTSGFSPSTFRHWRVFTLRGAHTRLRCSACHPNYAYARVIGGGSTACVSCHGARHGGLRNCSTCHTTSTFDPATFRHSSVWRLTGAHASLRCSKCHPRNRYASVIGSPSRCSNCHGTKHGNQTRCEKCHTTRSFSPAKDIAHPVFPALSGEHASRSCSLCHTGLNFAATPKACSDCHSAPHIGPADCLRCHRPTVWTDIHFAHSDIGYHTSYAIEDVCGSCHTTGNYAVYECVNCH